MQLYFVKATYTNNVYKLSDFFIGTNYKLDMTKMLDINFKPDDGLTSFITKNITLPDESSIKDHTHVIIPDYDKIYRIASVDYLNVNQYLLTLDDDPLIANYQTLKDKNLFLQRTNDATLFRGVNDIADLTLKESVETVSIESALKTGKWALLFFQKNLETTWLGLNFRVSGAITYETYDLMTDVTTKYPEVITDYPSQYGYYQKIVQVTDTANGFVGTFQCVYDESSGVGQLRWVKHVSNITYETYNFLKSSADSSKINPVEVATICIALPFESDLYVDHIENQTRLLSYADFIGPENPADLIDIKVIDGNLLKAGSITYNYTPSTRAMIKQVSGEEGTSQPVSVYNGQNVGLRIPNLAIASIFIFNDDFDITPDFVPSPLLPVNAEPFYKYDLYIYGKKFVIPAFLTDDIHIKIAMNTGVVNYIIYYNHIRNIIASGSFTHSIKYQVDNLDAFYNQNPTYKEQFFAKMSIDALKGVVGGAIGGSVIPGLGTVVGGALGLGASGIDAGISLLNLGFMEKGLKLKPDQIYGEISEVSLQVINIFGIYWVKRISGNIDMMLNEYYLKGFPTSLYKKISDLTSASSVFGNTKIVYGELKEVIKSEYITGFINQKLKEGVVFIE